jgi:hypothetical protein
MKTVNPNLINDQVNKCFLEYDPDWKNNYNGEAHIGGFKYYLERSAGLKLDFQPEIKNGHYGYKLNGVEIVDGKKYTMWLLKYT